jgi:hypothetical protein
MVAEALAPYKLATSIRGVARVQGVPYEGLIQLLDAWFKTPDGTTFITNNKIKLTSSWMTAVTAAKTAAPLVESKLFTRNGKLFVLKG